MAAPPLFSSDLLTVRDFQRRAWHAGRYDGGYARVVTMVRRGLFSVDGAGELVVIDSATAGVYDGKSDYSLAYPVEGGADCTQFVANPEMIDEAFPDTRYKAVVSAGAHLKHLRVYAAIRRGEDAPAIEDAAIDLLWDLSAAMGGGEPPKRLSRLQQRRMCEVRALMIAEPEINHSLSRLAGIASCSPYHFARLFRQDSGYSVRGYRIRLRLAFAATRLLEGETDLAGLAFDAGFSHHSHMTAAFRSVLGVTPSEVRADLAATRRFAANPVRRAA